MMIIRKMDLKWRRHAVAHSPNRTISMVLSKIVEGEIFIRLKSKTMILRSVFASHR